MVMSLANAIARTRLLPCVAGGKCWPAFGVISKAAIALLRNQWRTSPTGAMPVGMRIHDHCVEEHRGRKP